MSLNIKTLLFVLLIFIIESMIIFLPKSIGITWWNPIILLIILLIIIFFILLISIIIKIINTTKWRWEFLLLILLIPISLILLFTFAYMNIGLKSNYHIINDFSSCLYFSSITFTNMSFGEFIPSKNARFLVVLEIILGYISIGLIIGIVFYCLSNYKNSKRY